MFLLNTLLVFVSIYSVHSKIIVNKNEDVELDPPWIVTYRYVGESYDVYCRCYKPYSSIEWIKANGESILNIGGRVFTRSIAGGIVLMFRNITQDAEGSYECVATDDNKSYSNHFMLNVADPIIFDSPTYYEVVLNEDVFLECKVNEKLIPDRDWEFRGEILLADEHFQYEMEGILIPNVGLHDAGKYSCVISHSPFQTNSNRLEIMLIVYHKPIPIQQNSTVYSFINEIASLPCLVITNPPAWFIWYNKHGKPVNPKNENITIINQNSTSYLKVFLTEYKFENKFVCEACNELGCAEQTIELKSTVKLKTPLIGLWDIDDDSAEFYISTQPEAYIYIFQYYFDVEDDEKWSKAFGFNLTYGTPKPSLGSYFKYEVGYLHPDTKYIIRVAAVNNYTMSDYSIERRFKTRVGMTSYKICNSSDFLKSNLCSVIVTMFVFFMN